VGHAGSHTLAAEEVNKAAAKRPAAVIELKAAGSPVVVRVADKEVNFGNRFVPLYILSKGAVVRRQSVPNQTHGKKQLEHGETQPRRNDLKEQKGGPQADQRAGEVERGAHNQKAKGRNPQGNKR
jgi:hypothetical protein